MKVLAGNFEGGCIYMHNRWIPQLFDMPFVRGRLVGFAPLLKKQINRLTEL